ncbi:MAG TPA: hypothetical protein PK530_18000, partial [Anaerolineales bacterium]|nr:hypothetical protein [Anaerolineales bacterium]
LNAGLELAEETIQQLEDTAQAAQDKASEAAAQAQSWVTEHQATLDARTAELLAMPPTEIPLDRDATIESAFSFLDGMKTSLEDGSFSQTELTNLAQLRANTVAGLQTHGGPQLEGLSGMMDQLMTQAARGQVPQARAGMGNFEASLPARPSGPGGGLPGGGPGGGGGLP